MRKVLLVFAIFTCMSLFVFVIFSASRTINSSSEAHDASINSYFFPNQTFSSDPLIRAGLRLDTKESAVGEELKLTLIVVYREDQVSISTEELKKISVDPFVILSVKTAEGKLRYPKGSIFLAVEYTIQCVKCIPGREYAVPSFPLVFVAKNMETIQANVVPTPGTILTGFMYNKEHKDFRGIKSLEHVATHKDLAKILIGGGLTMGFLGIISGTLALIAKVMRIRRKAADPICEEFRSSVALFIEEGLHGADPNFKSLAQELYIALARFVFKTEGIDIMEDCHVPLSMDFADLVRNTSEKCEMAYGEGTFSREDASLIAHLCQEILKYVERRG